MYGLCVWFLSISMIILRFIHVIASIVCCGYLLASMNSVISMNGSYTHSAMHVEKYVRTLVIKMFLRMLKINNQCQMIRWEIYL